MAEKIFGISFGKKDKTPSVGGPLDKRNVQEEIAATKRFVPGQPSINIIPLAVLEGYNTKTLISNFGKAIAAFIVLVALLFAGKLFIDMQAAAEIDALERQEISLQTEAKALSPFSAYINAVDAKRQSLYTQFANDVNFYQVADAVNTAAATSGVRINSMSFSLSAVGVASDCPTPDPFSNTPTIGCVNLDILAANNDALIQFTSALEANPNGGFVYAYFPSSSVNPEGIAFTGSVSFTNAFNNARYGIMEFPVRDRAAGVTTTEGAEGAEGTETTTETTEEVTTETTTEETEEGPVDSVENENTDTTPEETQG